MTKEYLVDKLNKEIKEIKAISKNISTAAARVRYNVVEKALATLREEGKLTENEHRMLLKRLGSAI